ncbi:MAG: TIGR04053 family radical SAM/SPASM domain-containing protein [Bryobacterales bacterium]|nr:TIGR04053 family radical SAM/SPASM domain-containing protein [Bryobacterales bacterium]
MAAFDSAPLLVIWEVTQACDLACVHCRASAEPRRHPEELTTEEGFRLLSEVRAFGEPLMIFTGGDPLKRPDIFELLSESVRLGLRTTITPSATPLLTREAVASIQRAGVSRMALSLDGADEISHDGFRGVHGSFHRTLASLAEARRLGLETQVNTTVTRRNLTQLEQMARLVGEHEARLWSVFFLVVTGRALEADDLRAEEYESVFARLHAISLHAPFDIKTTEAQHYRRYLARSGQPSANPRQASAIRRQIGINDGKGLVFVSHTGDICPSGFLPLAAGNVRRDSLAEVYRTAPLFLALRDDSRLGGKCGACEYRKLCGGSRARAYAATGDYLAEDPQCVYEPARARTPA